MKFEKGDKVKFTNNTLHEVDPKYPRGGAIGTFKGYTRKDNSRSLVAWAKDETPGDGLWVCATADLAPAEQAAAG